MLGSGTLLPLGGVGDKARLPAKLGSLVAVPYWKRRLLIALVKSKFDATLVRPNVNSTEPLIKSRFSPPFPVFGLSPAVTMPKSKPPTFSVPDKFEDVSKRFLGPNSPRPAALTP